MSRIRNEVLAACIVLILTACGGSDGGSDETVARAGDSDTATVATTTLPASTTTTTRVQPKSSSTTAPAEPTTTTTVKVTPLGGGASVVDLTMADGTRFAVLFPTGMVPPTLAVVAGEATARLVGGVIEATLSYEFCAIGDPQILNSRGAVVAATDNGVVICRPDQYLVLRVLGTPSLPDDATDAFDIVPIKIGARYAAETIDLLDGICCDDFGPIHTADLVITANRFTSGTITGWEEATLVPRWSATIGESSLLLGSTGKLILATPGSGRVVALDAATGITEWQTPLPDRFATVGAAPDLRRSVWYVTADEEQFDTPQAPQILAIDMTDGSILWTAVGEPVTHLQLVDPAVFHDVVVVMDAPSFSTDGSPPATVHLIGFDLDTGDRQWITSLDSPTEGFSARLLVSDSERGLLIAATPDGVVFSVDPNSGVVRWRTQLGFARIVGIDADAVILEQVEQIRLDLQTGTLLSAAR